MTTHNVNISFEKTEDDTQFAFVTRSVDGVITTKQFSAQRWFEVLNEFIVFLNGSGFLIQRDSIAVNDRFAKQLEDFIFFNFTTFNNQDETDE